MKTFEECCEEVAKKYFPFGSWRDIEIMVEENFSHSHIKEAANLYATEIAKEVILLARESRVGGIDCTYCGSELDSKYTEQEILSKLGLL